MNRIWILTKDISRTGSGMTIKEYKGLKKQNVKNNMTNIGLILNMLAEVLTTVISKAEKS